MSKSLTETAKAILAGQKVIKESNDPTPDRDAKAMNPNRATLRPGSRGSEGRFSNPGATPPFAPGNGVQDMGPAPNTQAFLNPAKQSGGVAPSVGDNLGAKSAGAVGKDTSASSQASRGTPPGEQFGVDSVAKQDRKSKEVMEEEIEISEELEAFIKEMMEQGLSEEEIAQAIEENFELVSEEYFDEEEQLDELKKATLKRYKKAADADRYDLINIRDETRSKKKAAAAAEKIARREKGIAQASDRIKGKFVTSYQANEEYIEEDHAIDMSEHIEALFQGEDLSEEFMEKAKTIFEAAVRQKVEEEVSRIQEAYTETLEEQVQEISENLSTNVDDYLNYVVEQWVNENEVAIESGLRTELTEDFISGLRQLFAENYIDIPEDKISVVEELGSKVESLEARLNEEIDRNVKLNKSLNESKKYEVLSNACDGLTNTQAEKLKSLAEGVEFTTANEFTTKISTLRENYFPTSVNSQNVLDKAEAESSPNGKVLNEELTGPMAAYVRTLGRKLPN